MPPTKIPHVDPEKPCVHWHVKPMPFGPLMHVAPFWHGLEEHGDSVGGLLGAKVGMLEGLVEIEGEADAVAVGEFDGTTLGAEDGRALSVGSELGWADGEADAVTVGEFDGTTLGSEDGRALICDPDLSAVVTCGGSVEKAWIILLGELEGIAEGRALGDGVEGDADGISLGALEGIAEGRALGDGVEGDADGISLGILVGSVLGFDDGSGVSPSSEGGVSSWSGGGASLGTLLGDPESQFVSDPVKQALILPLHWFGLSEQGGQQILLQSSSLLHACR